MLIKKEAKMAKKALLIFLFPLLFNANIVLSQDNSVEINQALEYFREAQSLSENDNGNLWGIQLYGPMFFVNPETRFIIANQSDNENYLEKNGEVYCGILPNEVNIANTALIWKGKKWTMVMWPLPENKFERTSLIMHELFHRIQETINLPPYNPSCNHLDQKEGRILLRLEWQELVLAFKTEKQERLTHIKNAMTLNKYRKELYPGADSLESQMELSEGLAEYTGLKLSGADEKTIMGFLAQKINTAETLPSFVRSFAYISGPLYCFLLDNSTKPWRTKIDKTTSLSALVSDAYSIHIGSHLKEEAQLLLTANKESAIVKYEDEREKQHQERLAALKDKFFNKAVIVILLQHMNVQFDPRNLVPLESVGTVYPTIRISDDWGILTVTHDALLAADWKSILISLPDSFTNNTGKRIVTSPDWTLELNEGWKLKPAQRKGSYILSKID
jgi:hypothetical protein